MPRFHFTLRDGEVILDPVGVELADTVAAQIEGARYAAEQLASKSAALWSEGTMEVEISDFRGAPIGMLTIIATHATSTPRTRRSARS